MLQAQDRAQIQVTSTGTGADCVRVGQGGDRKPCGAETSEPEGGTEAGTGLLLSRARRTFVERSRSLPSEEGIAERLMRRCLTRGTVEGGSGPRGAGGEVDEVGGGGTGGQGRGQVEEGQGRTGGRGRR